MKNRIISAINNNVMGSGSSTQKFVIQQSGGKSAVNPKYGWGEKGKKKEIMPQKEKY